MSTTFNTRPVLNTLTEALTLITMVGLTFASAAALATAPVEVETQVIHQLPTVEIVGQKTEIHQLPTVVITVARSH